MMAISKPADKFDMNLSKIAGGETQKLHEDTNQSSVIHTLKQSTLRVLGRQIKRR